MPPLTRVYTWMILPLLSVGVQAIFAEDPYIHYQGLYQELNTLIDVLGKSEPGGKDIVMMDFARICQFPPQDFLAVKTAAHSVHILFMLSQNPEEATVIRALRLGAEGYLLESSTPDSVVRAVKSLAAGRCYLEPQVTPLVLAELRKPAITPRESDIQVDLTERERALLQLAADGLSNRQIADLLGLRDKTVRNLWSTLFEKIHMNDRTQAVLWAIRSGYAELR